MGYIDDSKVGYDLTGRMERLNYIGIGDLLIPQKHTGFFKLGKTEYSINNCMFILFIYFIHLQVLNKIFETIQPQVVHVICVLLIFLLK